MCLDSTVVSTTIASPKRVSSLLAGNMPLVRAVALFNYCTSMLVSEQTHIPVLVP